MPKPANTKKAKSLMEKSKPKEVEEDMEIDETDEVDEISDNEWQRPESLPRLPGKEIKLYRDAESQDPTLPMGDLSLFPHQTRAVNNLMKRFEASSGFGQSLLSAPPGSGKTLMCIMMMARVAIWYANEERRLGTSGVKAPKKVLYFMLAVPSIHLLEGFCKEFYTYGGDLRNYIKLHCWTKGKHFPLTGNESSEDFYIHLVISTHTRFNNAEKVIHV